MQHFGVGDNIVSASPVFYTLSSSLTETRVLSPTFQLYNICWQASHTETSRRLRCDLFSGNYSACVVDVVMSLIQLTESNC